MMIDNNNNKSKNPHFDFKYHNSHINYRIRFICAHASCAAHEPIFGIRGYGLHTKRIIKIVIVLIRPPWNCKIVHLLKSDKPTHSINLIYVLQSFYLLWLRESKTIVLQQWSSNYAVGMGLLPDT